MAQRGAPNKASLNRALRTRSCTKTVTRRSWCTRSSQPSLTTSTSKSTTSSLQRTLLAIFWFSFLFSYIFVSNIFCNNSFWKQEVEENNELFKTAWAQEHDKHLADKPFQNKPLQQQLPENIQEKTYKKEKLELQEHHAELSGRSAFSQQFSHNFANNKPLPTELWEKELGMNLAELAAWNIQLLNHNHDNMTIELSELGSPQLSLPQPDAEIQLQQLCLQDPPSAFSRQLPKESLSPKSLQTAAWPAATLTDKLSFSKQRLSAQDLPDNSFDKNKQKHTLEKKNSEKELDKHLAERYL